MFRYVVANLIAWLLRPIVRAVLVLATWFIVTIPTRLWVLYVDRHAGARTLEGLSWATAILLLGLWLLPRIMASVMRRLRAAPRHGPW